MSHQLEKLRGYNRMVEDMLAAFPEEEAMARAVGGDFERFGILEHCLMRFAGLQPADRVLDVGCGSGRLAVQLARYPALQYHGTDVVVPLLKYAQKITARDDFKFSFVDKIKLPQADESVDMVVFFSVVTHLLPEESFVYLEEAMRVLRPGGKVIFSFLDTMLPEHWYIFQADVAATRSQSPRSHLNTFLHQQQIDVWAERIGAEILSIFPGTETFIEVPEALATENLASGQYAFGQSVVILGKPIAVTKVEAPITRGYVDGSFNTQHFCGWATMEGDTAEPLDIEIVQHDQVIGRGTTGLHREGLGPYEFHVNAVEPVEEGAMLSGDLVVRASYRGSRPVPLMLHEGLVPLLHRRHVAAQLAALPETDRADILRELGVDPTPARWP